MGGGTLLPMQMHCVCMNDGPTKPRVLVRSLIGLALAASLSAALSGCQKTLFAGQESRTQFDQHDRQQDQHPTDYVFDAFGQRHPNLRGRLLPRD